MARAPRGTRRRLPIGLRRVAARRLATWRIAPRPRVVRRVDERAAFAGGARTFATGAVNGNGNGNGTSRNDRDARSEHRLGNLVSVVGMLSRSTGMKRVKVDEDVLEETFSLATSARALPMDAATTFPSTETSARNTERRRSHSNATRAPSFVRSSSRDSSRNVSCAVAGAHARVVSREICFSSDASELGGCARSFASELENVAVVDVVVDRRRAAARLTPARRRRDAFGRRREDVRDVGAAAAVSRAFETNASTKSWKKHLGASYAAFATRRAADAVVRDPRDEPTSRPRPSSHPLTDETMVIFGGTGALGVVFAAHHIENATPRSIVSTSVILASRSGRGSTLGRVFASRASPFVVRACAANAVSVDGASRIVPRDARAWIHAGGALRDASVDAIAHGATRIVTSAKRSAAIRVDGVAELAPTTFVAYFSSVASFLGSAGQTSYAAANAWLDGRAERRSRSGVPTVAAQWGPWGGAGMATRDSTLRARLSRKGFGFLAPEDGVAALRAAIEVATASTELRFQPVVCVARARGGGSRRTRQNVAETSRRSSPTSSNERDGSRIMRRDRRGHRRASPSIPTEPNPSLRSRLCVPIDRSIWRR